MLAVLRHPLLLPLIDYGAASATTLFEAYAMQPPLLEHRRRSLSHVVRHGTRFLEAHGIALSAIDWRPTLLRPLVALVDAPRVRRAVRWGCRCSRAAAWNVVAELLSARLPRGADTDPPRGGAADGAADAAGWRSRRLARFEGYVPVCPDALWPVA